MSNDEQRKRVMEKARFWYGKSGWRSGEITQDQMDSFATLLAQEAEIEKLRDGEPTEFVLHQINEQLRQRVAELEAELVENGTLVKTIRAERDQYKSLYADEQEVCRDEVDEALKGAGDGVEGNYGTVTVSLKQWREMNEEIARLREALEFVRYYDFKFMVEYIDEALAGGERSRRWRRNQRWRG